MLLMAAYLFDYKVQILYAVVLIIFGMYKKYEEYYVRSEFK